METTRAPIILVPGFWLGAWAWDEVAAILRADGHDVTALTLPGLESADVDRSGITLSDHVDAICAAVEAAGDGVVLAVHSGAGAPGYAASDRLPEKIATMVYVDTGPATGALDPDVTGAQTGPPTLAQLGEDESLEGISPEQLAAFEARAVAEPAGPQRDAPVLENPARLDVPTVVICTSFTEQQYREAAAAGFAFVGGLTELHDVQYVDLPTSHWPMWSRPADLAALLGGVAERSTQ
ncbi:hypothetical protein CLV28_1746 [Sediminihabitans luteus]|uniref:AB hydrolase-1 domain-containing protein n=1 Tax=Sediminihabitans luteus TaxID=1138585 RepID=A0A2M9CQP8_9CELL|nr:alpha/beta hydrolase [Sediminihabitans luteus]PJJ74252.1 hypothetical protein CLV28_1746 [Sediminihabitans luteus]GII99105.1 hypothetical protein Slu03_14830 [Sediminihabitans luteus]